MKVLSIVQHCMVWKSIVIIYLFLFFLLYKFKFHWKIAFLDLIITALCGSLLWYGNQLKTYVYLIKYVLLALPTFYTIRFLASHFKRKIKLGIISFWQLLYLLLPATNFFYCITTTKGLGKDAMFALAQTNYLEAKEFLLGKPLLTWGMLCMALVSFFVLYYSNKILDNDNYYYTVKTKQVGIVFLGTFMFLAGYLIRNVMAHSILYGSYVDSKAFINKIANKEIPQNLQVHWQNPDNQLGNIVVVIGESANRDYFSLYNYKEDTTPWLYSEKGKPNFIWFLNAYTCNKFTSKAVPMVLSESNQYNGIAINKGADLVDIFHKLGYKVWWISNQGRNNNLQEGFMPIAMRADYRIFVNANKAVFDIELVHRLPNKVTGKNLFFLHQMGSHGNYNERSPQEFKKFHFEGIKEHANDLNQYCNSILYTDYILKNIYAKTKEVLKADVMLYFSDHGEKPGVPRDRFDFAMTRIPLLIWFSDDYMCKHENTINQLKLNQHRYFTNDMLYDTIIGLSGIKTNHYGAKYDLSSSSYEYDKNTILTEYGTIKISEDPYDAGQKD